MTNTKLFTPSGHDDYLTAASPDKVKQQRVSRPHLPSPVKFIVEPEETAYGNDEEMKTEKLKNIIDNLADASAPGTTPIAEITMDDEIPSQV